MVPLDREDPHVRRLIESMAFFSVQTRLATQHNLRSTWLRLFSAFFDFLLQPLPAVALVQALPAEKMTETVVLSRGTELRLAPAHGVAGSFRTQRHLRILPISMAGTEVVRLADGRCRLILRFESSFPRRDPVGLFSLHVRHLDEYRPSLAVFHALRKQLTQVGVVYDAQADENSQALPCEFSFDTPRASWMTRAPRAPAAARARLLPDAGAGALPPRVGAARTARSGPASACAWTWTSPGRWGARPTRTSSTPSSCRWRTSRPSPPSPSSRMAPAPSTPSAA